MSSAGSPPVLRSKALEVVDDQGRVRVEMKVFSYTTLLQDGGPNVRLVATEDGAGLSLVGPGDTSKHCRAAKVPS